MREVDGVSDLPKYADEEGDNYITVEEVLL